MKRLLLLSNSTQHGQEYLDHSATEIQDFLTGIDRVLFVPYALHDHDSYWAFARNRFANLGFALDSIHKISDPIRGVQNAAAIFIGGGNTFRLLNELYKQNLLDPIAQRVLQGAPYIGSSAGTNVASLSIKTTNDMPIIYPPSFTALGLFPANINCHYLDPDPNSKHMGETRDKRIQEFHEENSTPVIALREGAWLRIEGEQITLQGQNGAKLFCQGENALELNAGLIDL